MITPMDIHNKTFSKKLRGYADDEVNSFLDEVASDYERIYREHREMEEQMDTLKAKLANYEKMEATMSSTLVMAQETAENVKTTAKKEAEVIVREAQNRAARIVSDAEVAKITEIIGKASSNLGLSDIGFYVDTLGRTKPIDIDGATPPINSQLIIGTEYSEKTNKKQWLVKGDVIKPFLDQIQGRNFKLTSIAGSLTWIATLC